MSPKGFSGIKGEVITPGNLDYDEARQERNKRIQRFPRVIVYCENKRDVSLCIEWARRRGAPIRIRGGGYNDEGYSSGNGALVIDLSRMNRVMADGGFLRAEGGADNRALYDAAGALGYAFPGGACQRMGVAGLVMGGGWGPSCRMLGLTCDSLVSAELVDAYGRGMTANSHCNQELFWALRGGGGGSFGVVTGLVFRLPETKTKTVTLVKLRYPDIDTAAQARFWEIWQSWLNGADERVTLRAVISHSAEEGFAVDCRGLYYGTPEEAAEAVGPLAELPGCEASFEETAPGDALRGMEDGCPPFEMFKSAGRFVTRPLESSKIRRIVESLRDDPEGSETTAYTLYALGGAVAKKRRDETAFYYRDAEYIAEIRSAWAQDKDGAANMEWVDKYYPALADVTAGSYVNFPYGGLKDYMRAYYGGNAGRLRRVKRMYDPYNVFRHPQSVWT